MIGRVPGRGNRLQRHSAAQIQLELVGIHNSLGWHRLNRAMQRKDRPERPLRTGQQIGRLAEIFGSAAVNINAGLGHRRQQGARSTGVIHVDMSQHDMAHLGGLDAQTLQPP